MTERKNEIRQLTDVEHVRARPGMYVSSATLETKEMWLTDGEKIERREVEVVPGILKLFDEIISNAIDEAYRLNFKPPRSRTRRFSIEVKMTDLMVSVSDSGRGIPLKPMSESDADVDEMISDVLQAEVALTALRSGTNFGSKTEEDGSWVSIGTHGLGATLVNILSSTFKADITDGKKRFILECERGVKKSSELKNSQLYSGTKIEFSPDFEVFGLHSPFTSEHRQAIRKRIYDLSIAFPQIDFSLNGKKMESKGERALEHYMEKMHSSHVTDTGKLWRLGICPSEEQDHVFLVNGIDAYEGGTILDYVRNKVVEQVVEMIRKKHKLEVKPADVRSKLCFVLFVDQIPGLKFRSQTKEWVSNPASEFTFAFQDLDPEKIARRVVFDPEILDPIVESYRLKEKAKEKVELKRKKRQMQKARVISHVPAIGKDPLKKILFVTEGRSAIGQLSEVRDSKIHGGFPLRGKPMNVTGKKKTQVSANKELSELMSVIGLSPADEYEVDDLNYGLVAIMADADVDGDSITALLVNMFVSYWPKFVEDGRLCIVRSPLLKAERGKERRLFFRDEDYINAQTSGSLEGWQITYLKGLGSLTPEAYREMIENPVVERVTLDGSDMLETAFGPSADVRKEWLMEKVE